MNWLLALGLFGVGAITDVFWTRWSLMVSAKRKTPAAIWALLICLPAALWAPAYVQDRWYVLPYALGAALGTWVTVHHAADKA